MSDSERSSLGDDASEKKTGCPDERARASGRAGDGLLILGCLDARSPASVAAADSPDLIRLMSGGAASTELHPPGPRPLEDWPIPSPRFGDRLREQAEGERLAQRLVGCALPLSLPVAASWGHPIGSLAESSLVLYLYSGVGDSPDGGADSLMADAAQHRAFRDRQADLAALNFAVVGLSSQSQEAQTESAMVNLVSHALLSDPRLLFADAIGLPTVTLAGVRLYRRVTLVVRDGRVEKVFFPVTAAHRNADQALAWIKLNG